MSRYADISNSEWLMDIAELVVINAGWLRNKARRYYDNDADAEDLVGETVFKCLKQACRFDNERSFKPWALTIMENIFKNQYNRRKCVLFTGYDCSDAYICSEHTEQRASVFNIISLIRKYSRKSCCIESVMLYARGYNYDEISDMLSVPLGTVKSRVAAGRRMLREVLS